MTQISGRAPQPVPLGQSSSTVSGASSAVVVLAPGSNPNGCIIRQLTTIPGGAPAAFWQVGPDAVTIKAYLALGYGASAAFSIPYSVFVKPGWGIYASCGAAGACTGSFDVL